MELSEIRERVQKNINDKHHTLKVGITLLNPLTKKSIKTPMSKTQKSVSLFIHTIQN